MDAVLEPLRELLEGTIDFQGQQLVDWLSTVLLSIVGTVAFFVGFFTQDIYNTLYVGLAGTGLTFLITIPPWPFYNKRPLAWLPARSGQPDLRDVQIRLDAREAR